MTVSEFLIYVLMIVGIAFCWAFDDWCDSQIEIERLKTQQVYYESYGKAYKILSEVLKEKSDPIEQIIKQEEQK